MALLLALSLLFAVAEPVAAAEAVIAGAAAQSAAAQSVAAEPAAAEQVELFDTDRERVVQTFANSPEFQAEAKHMLSNVSGRVLDLSPSLENALILKIPLMPPQNMSIPAEKRNEMISTVFVVMPKASGRKPWLILHTEKQDTMLVEFEWKVDALRKLAKLR